VIKSLFLYIYNRFRFLAEIVEHIQKVVFVLLTSFRSQIWPKSIWYWFKLF